MESPQSGDKIQTRFELGEPELVSLGARLSSLLVKGDCLALSGEIGAGKSTLARAIIRHRLAQKGEEEEIPSPSFTLVQLYDVGETALWHFDLYRIKTADEAYEIGLFDALTRAICIIEWPECLGAEISPNALHVRLEHIANPALRRLSAQGPQRLIESLEPLGVQR